MNQQTGLLVKGKQPVYLSLFSMSKRLTRIFAPTLLSSLPVLINKEVNVVQRTGHTVFGTVESFTDKLVIVKDLRSHLHEIDLVGIDEIIVDRQSAPSVIRA